jgi:ribosome-associated toxin RatA of RatAB toxin-antitoxin module
MRTLNFEFETSAKTDQIWSLLTDVNNYHRYIKNCIKSTLVGDFKEGSSWYDWSTVVYLPLKVNHKIIKIVPKKEIIYQIPLPLGSIWQKLTISEGEKTKVQLEVNIDFPNRLIDQTLGALVAYRNQDMLSATINNFKDHFNENN